MIRCHTVAIGEVYGNGEILHSQTRRVFVISTCALPPYGHQSYWRLLQRVPCLQGSFENSCEFELLLILRGFGGFRGPVLLFLVFFLVLIKALSFLSLLFFFSLPFF